MIYSTNIPMATILIDEPIEEGTKTHFTDINEMYQYFHWKYSSSESAEEKPDDIVEYNWKKVSRYVRSIMEDEDEIGPFTVEEAISYVESKT